MAATGGQRNNTGRRQNTRSSASSTNYRNRTGNQTGSNGRTSSSGRRSSSATRAVQNDNTPKRREVDTKIQQEAVALIVFCVVFMVFLCMINVIKGSFGPAVKSFMVGSFGVLGYLLPILVFFGICFKMSNAANQVATLKLISGMVLIFMAGVLLCYFTGVNIAVLSNAEDKAKQLYDLQKGGGVVFGMLACWLYKIFGQAGTIFLAIVFALICIMIITEHSILAFFKKRIRYDAPIEEEDHQYALIPVENEEREQRSVDFGDQTSAVETKKIPLLELNHDKQDRRREELLQKRAEAKQKRQLLEEQKEDERIVTAHSTNKAEKKRVNMEEIFGEEPSPKISSDDIHEITVLSDVVDTQPEQPSIRSSNMKEIKPDMADDEFLPITEITLDPPVEKTSFENVVDLSQMPQPVTERTHQNNDETANDEQQMQEPPQDIATAPKSVIPRPKKYEKPKISLLKKNDNKKSGDSDHELKETALLLQQTLKTFGVAVTVTNISQGPSVTRYELQLGEGIKVNKIVNLADDIKLNLAAQDIRIEAPIPGKAAVGIELPNKKTSEVLIRDLIEAAEYKNATSNLTFAVGKDITGKTIVADIAKMPHMLVAGATGSGKSVCINTLIMSILYKAHPDDVKLIMIDPKVVELSVYNGIPHLLIPVVTDPRKANAALQWAVAEMTKRYKAFADFGLRDLKGYNQRIEELRAKEEGAELQKMPQIIVIVDELADLMMVASKEVEESICRLAQLARAAGIHLVIATQRPSVDVITGLIKANMPSRVAFKVTSGVDSRTILDMIGAEKLLGKGDMLFYPQGYSKPLRVQGAFVSDQEVSDVVDFLKKNAGENAYDAAVDKQITGMSEGGAAQESGMQKNTADHEDSYDAYFDDACRFVVEKEKASSGMLQRVFKVGYTRAARIVDQMEAAGVVGPEEGTKPRKVLMNSVQLEEFLQSRK